MALLYFEAVHGLSAVLETNGDLRVRDYLPHGWMGTYAGVVDG